MVVIAAAVRGGDAHPRARVFSEAPVARHAPLARAERGAHGHLGVRGHVARARHEVDDAEERARAVEHRARTADDLDALDVVEVRAPVEADVRRPDVVVVRRVTVDEDEDAVSVVAGAREPADADRVVARVVRQVHAAHAAHGLRDRRVVHRAELLRGDDRDARRRVLERLGVARRRGDLVGGRELEVELQLPRLRHLDRLLDRLEARERHAELVVPDRHVHDGGREAARLIVDRDERVAEIGVDDDRARLRGEPRARRQAAARRQIDRDVLLRVARFLDDERVAPRLDLDRARDRAEHGAVVDVELHGRAVLALDAHGSEDRHQRERDVLLLADGEIDVVLLRRLVARELDDDFVSPRGETEVRRRVAARPEISSIEVHRRAGRIRRHLEHRDLRRDAADRVLDTLLLVRARLAGERVGVIAVRVGRGLQLLVRARDVEEHVAVRHEPVRREEVLERAREVALLVRLRAELELQIRLVGEVVRARGDRAREDDCEYCEDGREAQQLAEGHQRVSWMSRLG